MDHMVDIGNLKNNRVQHVPWAVIKKLDHLPLVVLNNSFGVKCEHNKIVYSFYYRSVREYELVSVEHI